MNGAPHTSETGPQPAFWYGLPHGYRLVDLHPSPEALKEVAQQLDQLPEELRDRADQVFRLYATVVLLLQQQQVQGCALGMHPDGKGGATLSVLTVSSVPLPEVNAKAVLARMLADNPQGPSSDGVRPVTLPCGVGFLMETVRKTVAPGQPSEGHQGPKEENIWQGTVAIPGNQSSAVIMVQLVTPATDLTDDYRGVLLGVARTVSFTDPRTNRNEEPDGPNNPDSDSASTRSVFG